MFQYRKRYGLHAIAEIIFVSKSVRRVSIPQAVWIACNRAQKGCSSRRVCRFNTASGMDCMQWKRLRSCSRERVVSIPQAVWIACNGTPLSSSRWTPSFNTASGMDCMQYCLPEALETVSPEVGFLILTPFSRFPQSARNFFVAKSASKGA